MNQMQQMLMQAQKMQRELMKEHEALASQEFSVSKAGMVDVVMLGNRTIKSIHLDKDALLGDNEEMLEETITMAINEALKKVEDANAAIDEKVTGAKGGLPF
jgi:DNA-binding YbaB/EbfC family protein